MLRILVPAGDATASPASIGLSLEMCNGLLLVAPFGKEGNVLARQCRHGCFTFDISTYCRRPARLTPCISGSFCEDESSRVSRVVFCIFPGGNEPIWKVLPPVSCRLVDLNVYVDFNLHSCRPHRSFASTLYKSGALIVSFTFMPKACTNAPNKLLSLSQTCLVSQRNINITIELANFLFVQIATILLHIDILCLLIANA